MGVSMVSVAPGTRTMRGYVADVAVSCRLKYRPARVELIERLIEEKDLYFQDLTTAVLAKDPQDPQWVVLRTQKRNCRSNAISSANRISLPTADKGSKMKYAISPRKLEH